MRKVSLLSAFFIMALSAAIFSVGTASAEKGNSRVRENRPDGIAIARALLVEDFSYASGTLLTSNGWVNHSGTANFIPVSASGLTYPGYPSSGIGNAASMTTTGEDVHKYFPGPQSGSVYASFIVDISAAQATGDYFFHFAQNPISGNIFRGRVYSKNDGSGIQLGISKAANSSAPANIAYAAAPLTAGTHLVVVKYTIVPGDTNDTVDLFIDPNLSAPEPAPSASAPDITATDAINLSIVALRQGSTANAPSLTIDGIRVAKAFADLTTAAKNRSADFSGDSRADYAVTRAAGGLKTWYVANTGTSVTAGVQWGLEFDRDIVADFDGDGKTDVAVWREGSQGGGGGNPDKAYFYILQSSNTTLRLEQFGRDGDSPKIVGDYDGDGRADPAVFRTTDGVAGPCGAFQGEFYYRPSGTPSTDFTLVCWGVAGDDTNSGDFDGDGKFDFVIRRIQGGAGVFYLKRSSDGGEEAIFWGTMDDSIIPGDFDGDGRNDFAVARLNGTNGEIYILERDGGGTPNSPIIAGNVFEEVTQLACADYDGDGRTDIGIWQGVPDPTQNFFIVRRSSDLVFTYFEWGQPGDEPAAQWNVDG